MLPTTAAGSPAASTSSAPPAGHFRAVLGRLQSEGATRAELNESLVALARLVGGSEAAAHRQSAIDAGAVALVLAALRAHADAASLQANGCAALAVLVESPPGESTCKQAAADAGAASL
eukprot:1848934-Prymnesium_polylepis.1